MGSSKGEAIRGVYFFIGSLEIRTLSRCDFEISRIGSPVSSELPWVQGLEAVLQDNSLSVDDLVAEGDKVACRLSFEAVHQGDLFGVPATGRKIRSGALFIVRMAEVD